MLLGSAPDAGELAVLGAIAAITALIFNDHLNWFHLHPYLANGLLLTTAAYSLFRYAADQDASQLLAVAGLLVGAQSILLWQKKSVRIYEQLSVFCILQLIVAAILNDALGFGVLLVPFVAVGLATLVLLHHYSESERLAEARTDQGTIRVANEQAPVPWNPWSNAWLVLTSLAPPVLIMGMIFFYALPRTDRNNASRYGAPVTGFTDRVTLDQLGRLQQSDELVMRVGFTDVRSGAQVRPTDDPYLRGVVLDSYRLQGRRGEWTASRPRLGERPIILPAYRTRRGVPLNFERLRVEITQEPNSSTTLFGIEPIYADNMSQGMTYWPNRRQLVRDNSAELVAGVFQYRFITHGYQNGRQTPWLRAGADPGESSSIQDPADDPQQMEQLLAINLSRFPALAKEAQRVVLDLPPNQQTSVGIALAMEQHLSETGGYRYTYSLTGPRDRSLDPVEEFVAVHRQGHCQFFAAALALMLRSQGIPARLVVGYHASEYNELGKYYLVRQRDAHSWVEAYIAESELPPQLALPGQPSRGGAWLRLDPTPALSADANRRASNQAFDYAQVLWKDFVLERGGQQRTGNWFNGWFATSADNPYARFILTTRNWLARMRAGQLGAGEFSLTGRFSIPAFFLAMVAIVFLVLLFGGLRRILARLWRSGLPKLKAVKASGGVLFYDELLRLLAAAKIHRAPPQTPAEFAEAAAVRLVPAAPTADPVTLSLRRMTSLYYRLRFGGQQQVSSEEQVQVENDLANVRQAVSPSATARGL